MKNEECAMKKPILFQGSNKKDRYFEGWYFKQVCEQLQQTISFIPGVSLRKGDQHAFIQVIVAPQIQTHYFRFDISEFSSEEKPFRIRIASNTFSETGISINLRNEKISIHGTLTYGPFTNIESSLYSPTIMGPFTYIPNMECNHGVISMDHSVNGLLTVNDIEWIFKNDRGYLEKDWGSSFPKRYLWVQANHFNDSSVSFMASVAKIPFIGFTFNGVIANLTMDGKEHRFATYNGYKDRNIRKFDGGFSFEIIKGKDLCEVIVHFDDMGELKAPQLGAMSGVIKEGLGAKITVKYQGKTYVSDFGGAELVGY
jgi:tocopherol cyclase